MPTTDQPTIWWVRRDFRLADNPALRTAIEHGSAVLPLFVLDPALLHSAGTARRAWLYAALADLDADLRASGGPGLSVVEGRPTVALPRIAQSVSAASVHVASDFGPYGHARDETVERALGAVGVELQRTGSPYAVAPGTLRNGSGTPYQVFSPFHRAWAERGVHDPAPPVTVAAVNWIEAPDRVRPEAPDPDLLERAGEQRALRDWHAWLDTDPDGVDDYDKTHDFPAPDATSHLSIALRWGHLHPRTVLADLRGRRSAGAMALARQIGWRDFFADVLFHRPEAVTEPIRAEFKAMESDDPDASPWVAERLQAWQQGRTGYPLVDAGMRQLLAEGYMHNRVRMIVASFLIKDLHIGWWHGADWFMQQLRDGDIAQNQLNWQWVAGCGTDAAPYFRIFNPMTQSAKFDGAGEYIRRWVPELADVAIKHLHEPWTAPNGIPAGYPQPIVDHKAERQESLDRYAAIRR